MTRPPAGILIDRSSLPCLSSSLQGLIKDKNVLDFFLSLYVELLSQLSGVYVTVPKELWTIRGEIARLVNKLAIISQRVESADLTVKGIRTSLALLKHRSVCLYKKVHNWVKGRPCTTMHRKINIPTKYQRPPNSNTSFRQSSATCYPVHSESLPFQNTPSPAIPAPLIGAKGVSSILLPILNSPTLFQNQSSTPSRFLEPYCPVFQAQETTVS